MLERWTIEQSRYMNASTTKGYIAHCKKQNAEPQSIEIEDEDVKVKAHWIGNSNAESVIVYFHGGGYTQPATAGSFQYMTRLVRDLNSEKSCRTVAVLILAYSLAPEVHHPTPLREATAVLSYLLAETGRSPCNVFISGDSAGGNLALSVLSHILHPHPQVSTLQLSEPLGGMLLYSPWVSFRTNYPSFENNKTLDMLTPIALRKGSAMFLNIADSANLESDPGPVSGDVWTEASLNPASWWHGAHRIVSDVFVWSGGYEVFADSIKDLRRHLSEGWVEGGGEMARVTFLETPKEAHVRPIVDIMSSGRAYKSDAQVAIEGWYKLGLQINTRL